MIRKINDFVKSIYKKLTSYKNIRWIPFVMFLIVLVFVFYYIKKNTLIVLEGEPQNIIIYDFEGNVAMDTRMISIDKGRVVNRDPIIFLIDENKYTAAPHELVIEFDCDKDIEKYGYPYANYLLSQNQDMYYATTTGTEDIMSATSITFERSDNTLEYFHEKIVKASGENRKSKIAYINFGTPIAKGLL